VVVIDGIMLGKFVLWKAILNHSLRYGLSNLRGIGSLLRLIVVSVNCVVCPPRTRFWSECEN